MRERERRNSNKPLERDIFVPCHCPPCITHRKQTSRLYCQTIAHSHHVVKKKKENYFSISSKLNRFDAIIAVHQFSTIQLPLLWKECYSSSFTTLFMHLLYLFYWYYTYFDNVNCISSRHQVIQPRRFIV